MAGFPYHALDTYLPRLIRAGKRVAICDQVEDPKAKTLVKRGITDFVSGAEQPSEPLLLSVAVTSLRVRDRLKCHSMMSLLHSRFI